MHYLVEQRDKAFVKVYGNLPFPKNMSKNFDKIISKKLSGKYSLFDHAKQSATDAPKTTSKAELKKKAETTGDLIAYKIADKI